MPHRKKDNVNNFLHLHFQEESFIVASQTKGEKCFKNSSPNHFIKPSAKVISIQPVGSNKIDNVYWRSSKKSVSLNSQFNDSSLNDSTLSDSAGGSGSNDASIFEMETQPPSEMNNAIESIYTANTQLSTVSPSIHTANTQMPNESPSIYTANTQMQNNSPSIHAADTQIPTVTPSIHDLDTQVPQPTQNLPEVCKINDQEEMQFDLFASNKQNNNIFEAETQCSNKLGDENDIKQSVKSPPSLLKSEIAAQISKNMNVSDEVILFDDIDCEQFEDDFASQPLLPSGTLLDIEQNNVCKTLYKSNQSGIEKNNVKKEVVIHSDSSTDCEDIDMLPTQKIAVPKNNNDDDELTDCEDLLPDEPKMVNVSTKKETVKNDLDDMLTQVIDDDIVDNKLHNEVKVPPSVGVNLEDMLTQVIVAEEDEKSTEKSLNTKPKLYLEDMPTQVIVSDDDVIITEKEYLPNNATFEDMPTQVITNYTETSTHSNKEKQNEILKDLISPFKIPLMSPIKVKRKDIKVITPKSKPTCTKASPISISDEDDNYYAATQDIIDDLCTQPQLIDEKNDEFLPSSVEDYEVGSKYPHLDILYPKKKQLISNKSSGSSDGEERVNNFIAKLSNEQIRDMVGIEPQVASLIKVPSDSDIELTPKKVRPNKFMDIDLPSSQEIKTSVSVYNKTVVTESSSESEVDNDSEECTPILFHKKKKSKMDVKVDLTKAFDAETLPTRIITRVRKPTSKFQNSDESKKISSNILKPKFLTEQEDEIDKEIITENITRLKTKSEKSKNKIGNAKDVKSEKLRNEKENSVTLDKNDSKNKSKCNKINTENEEIIKPIAENKNDSSLNISNDNKTRNRSKNKSKGTDLKRKSNEKNTSANINEPKIEFSKDKTDENLNTTNESHNTSRSMRSTRNRRKIGTDTKEMSCNSIEENDSQNENKIKPSKRQNSKKIVPIDLTEEVTEVRRSDRQKTTRQKKEKSENKIAKTEQKIETLQKSKKPATRRGRQPKHEQSTVYSLSSDSSADTPKNAKRPATGDLDPPSPKRTRSVTNTNNVSLRSTPARMNKTQYVLFTAFPSEEVKAKLEKLGKHLHKCVLISFQYMYIEL